MSVRAVFSTADEIRTLAPGDLVFAEGDEGHEMFGVISGVVELRKGTVPVRTFLYLVHETPTFALQVMRSLAERLRQLDPPG